ncbi:MAG: flagellar biosynthesis protein FlhB [Campylobacteraceae bacterium]|nr:flagellar biosynthesis protein FlhB [Campylobacteraceae bacterium]
MASDDQEKTEEPTSKKIEDARKEGNVPKSQDTNSFVTLIVACVVVFFMFGVLEERTRNLYIYYHDFMGQEITKVVIMQIALVSLRELGLMILPIAFSVAIAGVLASLMQFGFLFTTKSITPDLKKIDPIKGLKNLFSLKKFIEGLKIVLKVVAVFGVAFYFLMEFITELPETLFLGLWQQLIWLRDKAVILATVMLALFLILSFIDLMFVRYNYFKELRMSKQEIKDEHKQMDGDPQVKSRIRKVQMQMSQKRMMQNIPDADVVITNPTHYAVAVRYNQKKDKAPVVIAKGVDFLALKIKEIALNHDVQIVENPPLARELYKQCDINQAIPENLYKAIAEVLAFVYQSSKRNRR